MRSSVVKVGPSGICCSSSSKSGVMASNSAWPSSDSPATSTPAETSCATIFRSARFSTASVHIRHVNRYVPSRPPAITDRRIDSGPMSTSPHFGHVIRIVVMMPHVSVGPRPALRGVRRRPSVAFEQLPGEAPDGLLELRRLHDAGVGTEAENQPDQPFQASRRKGDDDLSHLLRLDGRPVVLRHP